MANNSGALQLAAGNSSGAFSAPFLSCQKKPGYLDTDDNRNKRISRYDPFTNNDHLYRLGECDAPDFGTFNNKNRNRLS